MYQRRFFRRIALYQECVGNVLDLSSRYILADVSGPDVSTDREPTVGGSALDTQRTRVLSIPIVDEETGQLARIMQELSQQYGHKVGAVAISPAGGSHLVWAEPSLLSVQPASRPFRGMASHELRLETRVYHASVAQGANLLSPVPWEGTSTPGPATDFYGVTTTDEGAIAVSDPTTDAIWWYDADGDALRSRSLSWTPNSLAYYGGYLWASDYSNDRVKALGADGTVVQTVTPLSSGGTNVGRGRIAFDERGRLIVAPGINTLYVYSEGSYTYETEVDISSTPISNVADITHDGADLWVNDRPDGTLYQLDGVSSNVKNCFSIGDFEHSGLHAEGAQIWGLSGGGTLTKGLASTETTLSLTGPQPLRVRGALGWPARGYFGPTWRAEHAVDVDITGVPDVVGSSQPITLQMPYPMGGSEVQLQGVTGSLDGYAFSGTALTIDDSSRIGTPPQVLLEGGKYADLGINASTVWGVRCRVEDVASRPQLVVVDPGRPRGALRGAYSESCVASPAWAGAAVNSIAFDWTAEVGDQLSIDVTEAPGVDNYRGAISGEGEAVTGASAVFVADEAGTYTTEMVAQNFEGVTQAEILGPVDAATLNSLSELSDATVLSIGTTSDAIPFGQFPAGGYPPNLVELLGAKTDVEYVIGEFPDSTQIVDINGTPSSGNISNNPSSGVDLDYNNCSNVQGVADAQSTPSDAKRLAYRGTQIDAIVCQGIVDQAENTIETVAINATSSADSLRPLVSAPNFRIYVDRNGIKKGDLSGITLGSNCSGLIIPAHELTAPPDDFSQCASNLQAGMRIQGRLTRWPLGALDAFIDSIYAEREQIPSGNQFSFAGPGGSSQQSNPLSQDYLHKITGTGGYHPDASAPGTGGLTDAGLVLSHGAIYSFSVDSTSPTASPPSFTIPKRGGSGARVDNDRTRIDTLQGGSGTIVDRFQPGNVFRVIGGQNAGQYEIAAQTRDGNDDIVIEIATSPTSSVAGLKTSIAGAADGGTMVGNVYWPHTK